MTDLNDAGPWTEDQSERMMSAGTEEQSESMMSARRRCKGAGGQLRVFDDDPLLGESVSASVASTRLLLVDGDHHVGEPSGASISPSSVPEIPPPAPRRPLLCRVASSFVIPLTDQTGSPSKIIVGLFSLAIVGSIIGSIMPKDQTLPTPWYRQLSSIIGYTYFCAWSISFYPQVILNFKRKSTAGLSNEFSVLNVAGFACYSAYTLCFYFSNTIQRQYKERHGADAEITVQSNDVAFAVHALVLCCVQLSQIVIYRGFDAAPLALSVKLGLATWLAVCVIFSALVMEEHLSSWLDFLYMLSIVKVVISLIKYVPQVSLNYKRKSTCGWNIWNIVLDCTGGTLSIVQQIGDSWDLRDYSGITGNPSKFALGFVSIFFDLIFFLQHYVLYYPDDHGDTSSCVGDSAESDGDMCSDGALTEPLLNAGNKEYTEMRPKSKLSSEETPIVEAV